MEESYTQAISRKIECYGMWIDTYWYGHEGGGEAQFQDSTKMREARCWLARQDDLRYEII
jgi:hypothetical protein